MDPQTFLYPCWAAGTQGAELSAPRLPESGERGLRGAAGAPQHQPPLPEAGMWKHEGSVDPAGKMIGGFVRTLWNDSGGGRGEGSRLRFASLSPACIVQRQELQAFAGLPGWGTGTRAVPDFCACEAASLLGWLKGVVCHAVRRRVLSAGRAMKQCARCTSGCLRRLPGPSEGCLA